MTQARENQRRWATVRRAGAGGAIGALLVTAAVTIPGASAQPPAVAGDDWRLVAEESFDAPLPVDASPWVRDDMGETSPWNVDRIDEDGRYFDVKGGDEFHRQLAASDTLRKRVPFGDGGWLTAELAADDADRDGAPEDSPSFDTVEMGQDDQAARIDEPSHDAGVIIRNSRPLPSEYRIEYTLRTLDFGGKRNGSWFYDGKDNGYSPEGCKTNWPWKRSGEFTGPADPCNENFGQVRDENGYYFLSIMDYADPAPHNNLFIHNHRKVGMDLYATDAEWSEPYQVCNPATGELYPYEESSANGINAIFFDGTRFKDEDMGYNEFILPTECGTLDGATDGDVVSAADMRPELMPESDYRFAIERNADGYTLEMSGTFDKVGDTTLRYHRKFVEDGVPIWHYNQTAEEYDGSFDSTTVTSGPHGSYEVEQWPEGSAYPDYFIIGDPHLNYYEGSATIDDIRMFVPS